MKRFLFGGLLLLCVSACRKDDQKEPEIPLPPEEVTGTISGKVSHYDQFGTPYTTNLNTTTVSIEGKGFLTTTDSAGNYTLSGVTSNTYTLVFNKPGCGLIKKQNVFYSAGDTAKYNVNVADIPDFTLNTVYAKDTSWFAGSLKGIYYGASTSVQNKKARIVAIIGKTQNLDIDKPGTYLNYVTDSRADTSDFKRFFSYSLLKDTYSFQKDSILYMKVYPVSATGSSYFDSKYNTLVYTAHGSPHPTLLSLYVQ